MVACYPSLGTHYKKHVDNPNKDGRCITATYYINPNWHTSVNGGTLRIFPENQPVLDIAPQFNRIIFFWSDRLVHSVEPAHRTRYAITLWYHDAMERERALRRHQQQREARRIPGTTLLLKLSMESIINALLLYFRCNLICSAVRLASAYQLSILGLFG